MWAPDVYDGSPTPVTGYMATAVKAAAFAALLRVLGEAFGSGPAWQHVVWWLAIATMVGGNLIALAQRTVKRMLAYSSIAHAGYLLVAVATGTSLGAAAFLFYLVAYTLMTLAAFALLAAKGRDGERDVLIDDLAGLAQQHPWLAFALATCMLSLLGFPGTAGFIGKWYILVAATAAHETALAAAPRRHLSRVRHSRHGGRPAHAGRRARHRKGVRDPRAGPPRPERAHRRGSRQPAIRRRVREPSGVRDRARRRRRDRCRPGPDPGAVLRHTHAHGRRGRASHRVPQPPRVQRRRRAHRRGG